MMKQHSKILLLIAILVSVSPVSYSQSEPVARVIFVIGSVEVVRANGSREELQNRDPIGVGDLIETTADGLVHLRFIDSSLIALRTSTKLGVVSYRYSQNDEDQAELILHRGKLRSIAGEIGIANSRLMIGDTVVQGGKGDFAVTIAADDTQYFAVFDGTMTIINSQMETKLGAGADADFGKLEPGFEFEELAQYPRALNISILAHLNVTDCTN